MCIRDRFKSRSDPKSPGYFLSNRSQYRLGIAWALNTDQKKASLTIACTKLHIYEYRQGGNLKHSKLENDIFFDAIFLSFFVQKTHTRVGTRDICPLKCLRRYLRTSIPFGVVWNELSLRVPKSIMVYLTHLALVGITRGANWTWQLILKNSRT